MATFKRCSGCEIVKTSEEFGRCSASKDGRYTQCRECVRAKQKQQRSTEEYRAKRRQYRKRPEVQAKERAYMQQWSGAKEPQPVAEKECSSCCLVKPAGLFSPNKLTADRLASWCKACVARKTKGNRQCPDVKVRNAAYAKLPKVKAWRRKYRKTEANKIAQAKYADSDKGKASRARRKTKRRVLESLIENSLTGKEWRQILTEYGNACCYCKRVFGPDLKPTMDHVIPIAKGGHHTKDNVVPACMHCNCSKRHGDKPVNLPEV